MIRTLDILNEAVEDAEDAAHWYAERSATAAAAFADEIEHAVEEIRRTPTAWPPFEHGTRRFLLRRFPYSVVYRMDDTRIVIVAHAHRRPTYWRTRIG